MLYNMFTKSRKKYIQSLIDDICKTVPWATKDKFDINNNQWAWLLAHSILDDVDDVIHD